MMANPDQMQAFVLAAELGSFSAAARRMGKAQSAVSTAIANLEIDAGVELFDRTGRSPVLTEEGKALLPHARGILLGNNEFFSKASSMAQGIEADLCIAIEQGISIAPLMDVFRQFSVDFAHVSLELLRPGPNDTATLLKESRAVLGLMSEQESYPTGFQFRGVGHSRLVPVCAPSHPLSEMAQVGFRDLRQYRQLIPRSRSLAAVGQLVERKSTSVWYAESPALIMEFVQQGLGWAELPFSVVSEQIRKRTLARLNYDFQQSDILIGIDVVWTEQQALGVAAHWMRDRLLELPQDLWRAE
jgi:DNA-binding transcriptional LysR family regulator